MAGDSGYRVAAHLAEGLVLVTSPLDGEAMWSRARARKPGRCAASALDFAGGEEVYRPLGNSRHRWVRLRAAWVDAELKS